VQNNSWVPHTCRFSAINWNYGTNLWTCKTPNSKPQEKTDQCISYYLLTQGAIVPGNESSFHWNFRSWNFRSQERKFQGATVPESESSLSESSKNFRSRERMFQGAKVPESESSWNFRSQERKFHTMVLSLPVCLSFNAITPEPLNIAKYSGHHPIWSKRSLDTGKWTRKGLVAVFQSTTPPSLTPGKVGRFNKYEIWKW